MELQRLEQSIGYTFKNKELLKKALTHTIPKNSFFKINFHIKLF